MVFCYALTGVSVSHQLAIVRQKGGKGVVLETPAGSDTVVQSASALVLQSSHAGFIPKAPV